MHPYALCSSSFHITLAYSAGGLGSIRSDVVFNRHVYDGFEGSKTVVYFLNLRLFIFNLTSLTFENEAVILDYCNCIIGTIQQLQ
jgi:hypothetical protein